MKSVREQSGQEKAQPSSPAPVRSPSAPRAMVDDFVVIPDKQRSQLDGAVQMIREAAARRESDVHEHAAAGLRGGAAQLPHLDAIQRSFGQHDVSGVRAHQGPEARRANEAMGAQAYATGSDVAFREQPDLHTAAHEAAHVVQQRGGVQLSGGVGQAGDRYEGHADQVADTVVAGRSAEPLLDSVAVRRSDGGGVVQRQVQFVTQEEQKKADDLKKKLPKLIAGATWKEIRKEVYPKESAAGIERAKKRKKGQLPDMTGLGSIKTLDRFAAAVRKIKTDWAKHGDADTRAGELKKAADIEMKAASVPAWLVVTKYKFDWKAAFSSLAWMLLISEDLLSGNTITEDDGAELCNSVLHESRHAEQQYLAARYMAEGGSSVSDIKTEAQIPEVIAQEAHKAKLTNATGPVKQLAKDMHQATVTDKDKNQKISDDDGVKEMKELAKKAQKALDALNLNVSSKTVSDAEKVHDALVKQIDEVKRLYTLYRNIPYEADAHEVGDAAGEAFKGWN